MKNLELLIPKPQVVTDRWTWATVTNATPLEIRLDGDTDPLPFTPDTLASPLSQGDRVWVQISGRHPVILGRSGG